MTQQTPDGWRLFRGDRVAREVEFPEAPPWRQFGDGPGGRPRHRPYLIGRTEADVVSAALHLRRPLLVTGHPGTGKSSLAHAVAHELSLGPVLQRPVNSRSVLKDALYGYDAIGRLRETHLRQERGDPEPTSAPMCGSGRSVPPWCRATGAAAARGRARQG